MSEGRTGKYIEELEKKIRILEAENIKLRKERGRLKKRAATDGLTKLWNRRTLDKMLRKEISHAFRHKKPVSSVLLDIDFFKRYNDTFGHGKADELLKKLSSYLRKRFREEDVIGRYGGEEIEIILPDTGLLDAYKTLSEVRTDIEGKFGITLSGGVTSSENSGVILLYGKSGRELIDRYVKSGGQLRYVESDVKKYSRISGISETKVKIMLDNIYHFLIETEGIKTDYKLDSNYRKFGPELMRKFADEALYRAKEDGRNRIYAHTRPQEIILNPWKKSYYGTSTLS